MKDLRVSFPQPCSEPWDDMAPRGCNRHCASCDKVIHDLSAMTIEEVEELFEVEPEPCVRAMVSDGLVISKPSATRRRLSVALGSSFSLAAAACQTTGAPPRATIVGQIAIGEDAGIPVVKARDVNGRIYRAKVKPEGAFEIRNLPYGTYSLTLSDGYCRHFERTADIEANSARVEVPKIDWTYGCPIIVGVMVRNPGYEG